MVTSDSNSTSKASALRRYFPHVVACLALVSLLVVSTLLWMEMKRRFPVVEPGGYFGSMQGVLSETGEKVPFYVERPAQSDDLFFAILRPGWKPQVVSAVIRDNSSQGQGWLLPVTVVGESGKLKFIGSHTGPGSYQGTVTEMTTGAEGRWSLGAVEVLSADAKNDQELLLWLRRRADLFDIEAQIKDAEGRVPQQKSDIEKLSTFISEREQVQASADSKLSAAQDELAAARREVAERRTKLAKLQERIEIAQRLSPAGRLVTLARESLERDARWAESLLRTAGAETVPGLERAVERGQEISQIKREIELERNLIFKLRYPESVGSFGLSGSTTTVPAQEAP